MEIDQRIIVFPPRSNDFKHGETTEDVIEKVVQVIETQEFTAQFLRAVQSRVKSVSRN